MKNITLAIPFYNTSKYFLDCIKYSIDNDFVSEIVVNDDGSTVEEYNNLLSLVDGIDKIKVFRNAKNFGAFRNKYITVLNCTNEWIYLLDSDNYPFEESYDIIKKIPDDDNLICYSPQHLFCKHDHVQEYENISNYDFGYDIIGIEESKKLISKDALWFNWFINTGNYVFNKNTYLNFLDEPFKDESLQFLHADTAATFYYWLKNGGKHKVINGFRHNHRYRADSNWHSCGQNSSRSVKYYENKILEL